MQYFSLHSHSSLRSAGWVAKSIGLRFAGRFDRKSYSCYLIALRDRVFLVRVPRGGKIDKVARSPKFSNSELGKRLGWWDDGVGPVITNAFWGGLLSERGCIKCWAVIGFWKRWRWLQSPPRTLVHGVEKIIGDSPLTGDFLHTRDFLLTGV